jgi:hypothetical protein
MVHLVRRQRWFWRHLPHRHRPWHPGNYELWYCRRCNWALCHQSWLPAGDRHRWVTFEPREREWPDWLWQDHWTGPFGDNYERRAG